jgi:hypothetical protein
MRAYILATILAAVVPAIADAQTYRAVNRLTVVPLSGSSFEVIEAYGEGPSGMWCAAADYAKRRLGTRGRIYILEGRGASQSVSGRKSVVFTTDANSLPQGPITSISLSTSQVGVGLPINHAIQFCRAEDFETSENLFRWN